MKVSLTEKELDYIEPVDETEARNMAGEIPVDPQVVTYFQVCNREGSWIDPMDLTEQTFSELV